MRSLERALHLLTILEEAGRAMSVTELANASLLSKATVLRILLVLEKYWFVEKRHGRYLLGVAVLPLAHEYVLGNELARVSLPVLSELARTTKYTASLFVRFGFKRIAIQRVEGVHPLRFALPIGQRLPLHVGAGKVLTAGMDPDELGQLLDELEETAKAKGEKFDRQALLKEIGRARSQGYHVSQGERMEGTFAVAAPVVANRKTIAAATVSGSADKLTPKKIERLIIEVRDAAQAITERYEV
jgi:IclR family acetate operon transcriptional repressor